MDGRQGLLGSGGRVAAKEYQSQILKAFVILAALTFYLQVDRDFYKF